MSLCSAHGLPSGCEVVKELREKLDEARRALLPFANMHRKGSDPKEIACSRGTASDTTIITSYNFAEAARVLGLDDGLFDDTDALSAPAGPEKNKLYAELLYAVEQAFPGESRHETALRYIREAERRSKEGPAQTAIKPAPEKKGE